MNFEIGSTAIPLALDGGLRLTKANIYDIIKAERACLIKNP